MISPLACDDCLYHQSYPRKTLNCKPKATKEGKQFHTAVWEMPKSNNIYEINILSLWPKKKKVLNLKIRTIINLASNTM